MVRTLGKFWRGELSLPKVFWLFGALGFTLFGIFANFVAERLLGWNSISAFYFVAILFVVIGIGYLIMVLIGVWRSASRYVGNRIWPFLARSVVVLVIALDVFMVAEAGYLYFVHGMNDPGKTSYNVASFLTPQPTQPYVGFWRTACSDKFGLAIAPAQDRLYSVSFCGPSGCFKPGTYRPNTSLVGDNDYKVIDANTLEVLTKEGFVRYYRCVDEKSSGAPS